MARFCRAAAVLLVVALPCAAQTHTALELFTRADKGACAACHQLPASIAPVTRADVGPALDGTRMRALGLPRLRELLADPMRANPDTVMPPYGRHRILEPDEIARLVEFLHALP